jgi:hypothetical protein
VSLPPDGLHALLPAFHRRLDLEAGEPLRALLQLMEEQARLVDEDIQQLYENWFIETGQDWAVPYLGELVGYRPVHEAGQPGDPAHGGALRNRILIPRREVANTLTLRRRKGTRAVLEALARDVAGWPARAVEYYRLLAWSQSLNHLRLDRVGTADLRNGDTLDLLDGPFDTLAHTVDVRRPTGRRTPGRSNIPSVGLHLWRLRTYPVTRAPAYCLEGVSPAAYTFSVLGNDAPLFTNPGSGQGSRPSSGSHPAAAAHPAAESPSATASPSPTAGPPGPLDLPTPLRRRGVERNLEGWYGEDRSFALWADGWAGHSGDTPLPPHALVVADLTDWSYRPPRDRVAVDPVLGRIAFPPRQLPRKGVQVSYRYGFSDDLGGGEYARTLSQPEGARVYRVGEGEELVRINDALALWREEGPADAVVELVGGGVYVEQIQVELAQGQSLQLRGAERTRPVLRLMDWQTSRPDALFVRGGEGSRFTLDGVLVVGRSVHCEGPMDAVVIRHCTLVPGWTIRSDCSPGRPSEPSVELTDSRARVEIHRTILGSILVSQDEVGADPIRLHVSDSILDATSPEREAVGAPAGGWAHAVLTVLRTTVVGEIRTHAVELGENSIFLGRMRVARRQWGCLRYSWVTPRSRTPRRYRCQPDLAEDALRGALPRVEVGPDAGAALCLFGFQGPGGSGPGADVPGAGAPGAISAPPPANLEVALEVSDSRPEPGAPFTLSVTVDNRGPLDAREVAVLLSASDPTGLELVGDPVLSQGAGREGEGDGQIIWEVGTLAAGRRAMLSLRLEVDPAGLPFPRQVLLSAVLQGETRPGSGRAWLEERIRRERLRIQPRFTSLRYGKPGYGQLAPTCAPEIARGADDESEMGAFHDLFQPQRAANLAARLDEFVPAGMTIGTFYAT